jgi:hypothetical protein
VGWGGVGKGVHTDYFQYTELHLWIHLQDPAVGPYLDAVFLSNGEAVYTTSLYNGTYNYTGWQEVPLSIPPTFFFVGSFIYLFIDCHCIVR